MSTLAYLALGDSYSIGEGVDAADAWPFQLAAALRQLNLPLRDPCIIATTGWTTDELAHALDEAAPEPGGWDLVSLQIGVNDQYRGRALPEFATGFDGLLQRATRLCRHGARGVLVLSIPDWGGTPFAAREGRDPAQVSRQLDDYNAHIDTVCRAHGICLVDVTAASRTFADDADMLVADGLHPSARQYAHWTRLALAPTRALLDALA